MTPARIRKFAHIGLRGKAILVVATLVVASVIGASVMSVLRTNSILKHNQQVSVHGLGSALSTALELSLSVGDTDEMSRLAEDYVKILPDVGFILIEGPDGRHYVEAASDELCYLEYEAGRIGPSQLTFFQSTMLSGAADSEGEFFDAYSLDESSVPAERAKLGTLTIGVSNEALLKAQMTQWKSLAVTIGIVMSIVMPVVFIVVGLWISRLSELVTASQYISSGDYSYGLDESKKDEIGLVVSAYEKMRVAIRDKDKSERRRQQELQAAREKADIANQSKSQFLAHMSHEIRTPINGVLGMLELLAMTELTDRQKLQVDTASNSAITLLSLINDILDFSKIESGQMQLDSTQFDVHDLCESVVEMLAHKAAEREVELICDIGDRLPRWVSGDPTKLRQVIINLVNNAIKFTERGEVVLRGMVVSQGDDSIEIRVTVTDTGIGIPPEKRDRLFKSFSQVDATTTRKYGGTGLGLAISKGFVELMGGQIGITEERTNGSEFWFTAHVNTCEQRTKTTRHAPAELRGLRTMIVDDNHTNLAIYMEAFSNWGMRPSAFECGRDALDAIEQCDGTDPYKLIVLDMQMPEMDGVQVADAIATNESYPVPTMVMLTSLYHTPDQLDLDNSSLAACLHKPVRLSTLFELLSQVMSDGCSAPMDEPCSEAEITHDFTGARVLVAEDNTVNQMVIRELLRTVGIEAEIVANGRDAVERVLANEYSFILMDCEMPELDGYEATREIRATEKARGGDRHVPIIALTANAITGDREKCIAAGMDDYLTKPIGASRLFAAISQWYTPLAQAANHNESLQTELCLSDELINIDQAIERCAGSKEILGKILVEFERMLTSTGSDLELLLDNNRLDELRIQAHSLRGASANVGAESLSLLAGELEDAIKDNDEERIRLATGHVNTSLLVFQSHLPTLIAKLGEAA
jgi:signal transduction histidine kinase/CheY-like chemotaxis protein/HPt (histidine-containing phosphotransfer) domain-containing protein